MRYEEANLSNYQHAKQAAPVAYIPWGAHERHDQHIPLGADTLIAHGICMKLCAQTGGVVFPGIFCGHGTIKQPDDDSTFEFSRECIELLATEYLEQLAHAGFKVITILMGHYGCEHMEAIREVVADFNETHNDSTAWAFVDFDATSSEFYHCMGETCCETSCMMYLRPELVDLSRLPKDCDLLKLAEVGEATVNMVVNNIAPKILELLHDKSHNL